SPAPPAQREEMPAPADGESPVTLSGRTDEPSTVLGTPPSGKGRYQVFGEIARGGMGRVLHGRDPRLNRDLALKELLEQHAHNPEVVRRFLEEAQIGGQLQHPGVVPVYELDRAEDGRPFFTMKLVKGQTLSALLRARPDLAHDRPRFL